MSCKASHDNAREGTCHLVEGHSGDHQAYGRWGIGDKFFWPNVDKLVIVMDDDTVKLAALALFYRHAKKGEKWDAESKARQEEILGDARCVLEAATGFGKVRDD